MSEERSQHPGEIMAGAGPAGVLSLFVICGFMLPLCHMHQFTNRWAVRINGGQEKADLIAEKYGFLNMGQVCCLNRF